jgi:hypothetical protein
MLRLNEDKKGSGDGEFNWAARAEFCARDYKQERAICK